MPKAGPTVLLLSIGLSAGAAWAQTSPATPSGAAGGSTATQQAMGEFRLSKFMGLDVYGSENQKVGDIREILLDSSGNAKTIVIGVGGFLGIGEKNVGVPWSAVEWRNERMAGATTSAPGSTTTGAPAGMTAPTAPGSTAPPTASVPPATALSSGAPTGLNTAAPTPTTATGATTAAPAPQQPARSPAEMAAINGHPDHGAIKMTRADLQNAPAFRYYSDTIATAAPRQ